MGFYLGDLGLFIAFTEEESAPLWENFEKTFADLKDFCEDFALWSDERGNFKLEGFVFDGLESTLSLKRGTGER